MLSIEKLKSSERIKFLNPKTETAARVGIDNKKEILAASTLLNFNNLPAVIVIPDLLTPGIKDSIWNSPIKIASLYLKLLVIVFFCVNLRTPKVFGTPFNIKRSWLYYDY